MSKQNDQPVSVTVQGKKPAELSRRQAIQWVMGAVAASTLPIAGCAPEQTSGQPIGKAPPSPSAPWGNPAAPTQPTVSGPPAVTPGGYGVDPNLVKLHQPGDVWPLTLTDAQKKTTKALADLILPKDHLGPAASEVGVVEMMDDWLSAPYPRQLDDGKVVREGLKWLEAESSKRFSKDFAALADEQKRQICDDICFTGTAKPEFKTAAIFFARFRAVAAGAYFATPPGWEAVGYVGNVALGSFDGPPPEVLAKLGVTQTVL